MWKEKGLRLSVKKNIFGSIDRVCGPMEEIT